MAESDINKTAENVSKPVVETKEKIAKNKKTVNNAKTITSKNTKASASKTKIVANKFTAKTENKAVKYKREDDPDFNSDLKYEYINASKPKVQLSAALAYILFFLPLCWNREEKFAMYHCNQGLVLFIFSISAYIISFACLFVFSTLGIVLIMISFIVSVFYTILGICNASDGKAEHLPLIGRIKLIDWTKSKKH